MKKHVFVVLTNPVEGREDEYNECKRPVSPALFRRSLIPRL